MSVSAHHATALETCKQPGCSRDAHSSTGPWAGLCDFHISEEMKRRRSVRDGNAPPRVGPRAPAALASSRVEDDGGGGGFEAKVKELAKLARKVDRANARAKRYVEEALVAKRDAEAAERAFRERTRELMGPVA